MPTILREKNYISRQKLVNLIFISISLLGLLFFYIVYRVFTNSTITIYLVLSALFSIPSSLFIIKYILLLPHKDCNTDIANDLCNLPSYCYIINNVLFTDGKQNKFIDNIVIINNNIVCFLDTSKKYSINAVEVLKDILNNKTNNYIIKTISTEEYKPNILEKYIVKENKNESKELLSIIKSHLI